MVQIPKGSVHIEITEVAMSKNYIGKWQPSSDRVKHIISALRTILLALGHWMASMDGPHWCILMTSEHLIQAWKPMRTDYVP